MTPPAQRKRLLSLDGGGLLGLVSLGILARMEAELAAHSGRGEHFRLRDCFDYIAGTSTGAIIAAALMLGRSVAEIQHFYDAPGAEMFTPAPFWTRLLSGFSHKFDHRYLAAMLQREFTEETVLDLQRSGDLPSDRHLLVVTQNVTNDSCWPISTNPDAKYNDEARPDCNRRIPLWQLVRASTAAPSFFAPEIVELTPEKTFAFVDGGLTPHNNPALKLFQMATHPEYRVAWPAGQENILLVSVGTGSSRDPQPQPNRFGTALLALARRTPSDLMRGMNLEIDAACRTIGACVHGPVINREVDRMTGPSGVHPKQFTYIRYDADISVSGLRTLGLRHPGGKLGMDDVRRMDLYRTIGRAAAEQVDVAEHFRGFLDADALKPSGAPA